MTHEEKIKYMRLATGLAHFGFTSEQLDLLVSMYELVIKKKGKTDLDSMTTIVMECRDRDEKRRSEDVSREIKIKNQLQEFLEAKKEKK